MMTYSIHRQYGITLIELLVTVAIAAMIMLGLSGVVSQALQTEDAVRERNELTQQARFAMQRMVAAVQGTRRLLLPLADNPGTSWREHVREESVPPGAPEGTSTRATAVLAVTLPPSIDRDRDGWADANNDRDFLDLNNNSLRDTGEPERVDEDLPDDNSNDAAPGITGIDDNGDGIVDDSNDIYPAADNDEDDSVSEDPINGIDDDGDGAIDEDPFRDMNGDARPGLKNVDDDLDGLIDEGGGPMKIDDDEDGLGDEDWFDPVVYYLNGNNLIERQPAFTDINGDSFVTGADFTESVIAENLTRLRIERIPQGAGRTVLIDIMLELTSPATGEAIELHTRVRVGGGQ